jgi:hypothetical protein
MGCCPALPCLLVPPHPFAAGHILPHSHVCPPPGPLPQTELSWLLDNALAATARPGGEWASTSWQQLERELRCGEAPPGQGAAGQLVQLREPLAWLGKPCTALH